jgi:hypothetical protein
MIAKMLIFYEVIQFIPNVVNRLENSEPEPGFKPWSLSLLKPSLEPRLSLSLWTALFIPIMHP